MLHGCSKPVTSTSGVKDLLVSGTGWGVALTIIGSEGGGVHAQRVIANPRDKYLSMTAEVTNAFFILTQEAY